jgi:hypothetical protein
MKDLWQFIALGLNGLLLLVLVILAIGQEVTAGGGGIILVIAMAPASALMAVGTWRRRQAA